MKYKIIQFDKTHGVITIKYEDGITINFDLPIENGVYPSLESLDQMINNIYPISFANRLKTASTLESSHIEALLFEEASSDLNLQEVKIPDSAPAELEYTAIERENLLKEEIKLIVLEILKTQKENNHD
jgi:hypothetical protein